MKLLDNHGAGAERRPFDTPVAQIEQDIVEGYMVYREEVLAGEWVGVHPPGGISFAEYRRDYWQEALPDLMAGTY